MLETASEDASVPENIIALGVAAVEACKPYKASTLREEELVGRLYNKGNVEGLLIRNEEAFQHYKMIFREVLHNGKDVFIHSIFYRWICHREAEN